MVQDAAHEILRLEFRSFLLGHMTCSNPLVTWHFFRVSAILGEEQSKDAPQADQHNVVPMVPIGFDAFYDLHTGQVEISDGLSPQVGATPAVIQAGDDCKFLKRDI